MKRVVVLFTLLWSVSTLAQSKITEGVVIFKQTMVSDNEQVNAQFQSMGDMQSTTYFKGYKSRTEFSNPMSGEIINITNSETKENLMLMNNPMLGKKYKFQKEADFVEQLKDAEVILGSESKTILGYECQQYLVTMMQEGVEMKMELYTTEAILGAAQQTAMLGHKIKGFPLYMVNIMSQMGSEMRIISEATEVKKASVSDEKFNLTPPEGYEEMN